MTPLNRKLALHNLRNASEHLALRRRQAERYYDGLKPLGIVHGISRDSLPQSHFPVRVPAGMRDKVRQYLYERGIDTGMLFPLVDTSFRTDVPKLRKSPPRCSCYPWESVSVWTKWTRS